MQEPNLPLQIPECPTDTSLDFSCVQKKFAEIFSPQGVGNFKRVVQVPWMDGVYSCYWDNGDFFTVWWNLKYRINHYWNGLNLSFRIVSFLVRQGHFPHVVFPDGLPDEWDESVIKEFAYSAFSLGNDLLFFCTAAPDEFLQKDHNKYVAHSTPSAETPVFTLSIDEMDLVLRWNDPAETCLRIPLDRISAYLQSIVQAHRETDLLKCLGATYRIMGWVSNSIYPSS